MDIVNKKNLIKMKKLFFSIYFLFFTFILQAQSFEDAWRYSQSENLGTARFSGMSGAFSSMGGDLSALGLNPAGATTFSTNRFTGTLAFYHKNNFSDYFGSNTNSEYNLFDDQIINFDQIGAVWVFKSDVSDWNKIAVAVNFNKIADFGNSIRINGSNLNANSITDFFVDRATGVPLGEIKQIDGIDDDYTWLGENLGFDGQQAYLAYQAYVINPVDPNDDNNVNYVANAVFNLVDQDNRIYSIGGKSSFDFTIAGTYQKKLQLGMSFSILNIDYEENNYLIEDNYDVLSDLQYLKMKNVLRVEGDGLSLKAGFIYRLTDDLKLGFSYHSPEWFEINEYMKQSLQTKMSNGDIFNISPNIENVFEPYKLSIPSKIILGASAVLLKKGFISADYTYQNMSNIRFKEINFDADMTYFDNLNEEISDTMQAVHKLNLGAEIKLSDLSLRGGGFMSTSPLQSDSEIYTTTGYSLGLGLNVGKVVVDMSYMYTNSLNRQYLLNLPDMAKVDSNKNKFLISIRYNY